MRTNQKINMSFRAALAAIELKAVIAALSLCMFAGCLTCNAQDPSNGVIPAASGQTGGQSPLSADERTEFLKLIADLQARVAKLEAAGTGGTESNKTGSDVSVASVPIKSAPPAAADQKVAGAAAKMGENDTSGKYTPNLGFKIIDTEYGDMSISIYTYARYLNQLNIDPTYVDAFGITKNVQQRQDVQLQKLQFKFLGWIMSPKLRYFLYAWTSNANQGLGAQTVLAGNISYKFSDYLTLGGGIRSLPGTRSVEGNFPFWTNVDSRHIADEFFRPSYTSGIWATGQIVKNKLRYQLMLGNNMSTLGVPASRIDNGLNTLSSSLVWTPTGDFELNFSDDGWGDFFHHDRLSPRFGFHYSRSDENKESQPNSEQFENTQLRLSDGTVIFTPNIFGAGVSVTDARWQMTSFDGALKYHGFSLEGEYYLRWLDNFRGQNTQNIPTQFDHGFQIQGTAMLRPKQLQAYVGHSRIFGQYGNPWDFRTGVNFFPFKNKVVRWNNELLYLYKSPVGYTSVAYPVGGRGWVFSSSVELAF
jgi:hypothetical protein